MHEHVVYEAFLFFFFRASLRFALLSSIALIAFFSALRIFR